MKRLRFLPALLLILSACSQNIIVQGPDGSDEMGSVSIALTADERTGGTQTKAEAELPDVDDFRVAIYKEGNKMRLYNDFYSNTKDKEIKLNAARYRLVAQHGDTLGCGFDKPYYLAETVFSVEGYNTKVAAEAVLSNVKLAVEYGETITEVYPDYYTVVKHRKHNGKQVKFVKGETRKGYIPAGEMVLQIYVLDGNGQGGGTWKYTESAPLTYNPNDFVTFTITTSDASGKLEVSITVDSTLETDNQEIEVPAFTVPQDAPSITLAGFEDGNYHNVTEGVKENHAASVNFVARGELAHAYLKIESDYLLSQGVPAEPDFANLTPDQETALRTVGFDWDPEMLHNRSFTYIDLTGVINHLNANVGAETADRTIAKFTLKVEDSVMKTAEETFTINSLGIAPTVSIEDYNVWARKIVSPKISINRGNMELLKFQYSTDNCTWADIETVPSRNGNMFIYEKIPVESGTKYYFRSIYNGHASCSSPVVEITTEEDAQIGNRGFESYQLVQTTFKQQVNGNYTRNWYLPYNNNDANPWWACNSMQSMPDNITGLTPTWCKNFPSSGYVTDSHSGSKAAMLFCVYVGNTSTAGTAAGGKTHEGEIWIGTADASGNRITEGHAFSSRPAKLAFWYKYDTMEGKTFFVDAWIKDAAGNIIATAGEQNGPASSSWKKHTLNFNYTNLQAKAAMIYVRISASYGEGSFKTGKEFTLGEENVKAHAGCFLKIDDIELIYE